MAGDTGAQGSQRSSFLREEHLDFAKDEIDWLVSRLTNPLGLSRLRRMAPAGSVVDLGCFVCFHTRLLFNLIDSAQNSVENRVELVAPPASDDLKPEMICQVFHKFLEQFVETHRLIEGDGVHGVLDLPKRTCGMRHPGRVLAS